MTCLCGAKAGRPRGVFSDAGKFGGGRGDFKAIVEAGHFLEGLMDLVEGDGAVT